MNNFSKHKTVDRITTGSGGHVKSKDAFIGY